MKTLFSNSPSNSVKLSFHMKIGLDIGENEKDPAEFRDAVVLADKMGFDVAWLGDHFMPWMDSGKKSAYVWSLLGASLEASKRIKVGPYVTTPIGARYHPAIVAQAAATLDNMYPGRFLLGLGTGEAVNEMPFFSNGWPPWRERRDRLIEGTELIRKLWTSEDYFDFAGKYFPAKQIFLYTKPRTNLKILFSAIGKKFSELAGVYGDGLITLAYRNPIDKLEQEVFGNFDRGAKSAGKDPRTLEKIVSIKFTLEDPNEYFRKNKPRAGNMVKGALDEPDPRKIDKLGATVSDEDFLKTVN